MTAPGPPRARRDPVPPPAGRPGADAAPGADVATRPPGRAWRVAAATPDPELPVVTLADLGILRDVQERDGHVLVVVTPTYSGCPALAEIGVDLSRRLRRAGYRSVTVRTQLAPPWTTDWITAAGRRKLTDAGIAPPLPASRAAGPRPVCLLPGPTPQPVPGRDPRAWPESSAVQGPGSVACPRCGSFDTTRTADFAGTACRALYRCEACREPFEYVKPL